MKKLFQTTLFLTTGLLLLASCNSSSKNGTKELPYLEKPTPNPTPNTYTHGPLQFKIIDPLSGESIDGIYEFNPIQGESTARLSLFKLDRFKNTKIVYDLKSANLGFIKEDHSLAKGCQSRLNDEMDRQKILAEAANETNEVIKADLLEMAQFDFDMNKKELELEAGYIHLKSLLDFPDAEFRELTRLAILEKITDPVEKNILNHLRISLDATDFEFTLKDPNLHEYYEAKWPYSLTEYSATDAGTSNGMRVSNGFLCDLILGQVQLNIINSRGQRFPITLSSDE